MDRLQEAITKARHAGMAGMPVPVPLAQWQALVPLGQTRGIADNWARLRPCQPDLRALRRNRIVTALGGPDAAAFDLLRARTLQTLRANGWRRLAITSPTAGCGTGVVALNLAFGLSRQPETRIILTELHLRHPSLAGRLGLTLTSCLTSVLSGSIAFADHALCHQGNLALALCAGRQDDPASALLTPALPHRMAEVERLYIPDLTIFTLPPMQGDDTLAAIAAQVDCVLLVADAGRSTARDIDRCERDIAAQTNFMGVVLNKCRFGTD